MGARSQNWETVEFNGVNWVLTGTGFPSQQGGPWREGPSSVALLHLVTVGMGEKGEEGG
jgi:hypothetical protein